MALVMVLSFVMAIGIFMLLPLFIAGLFSSVIESERLMAVLEGIIRILIFIAYIKLVSPYGGYQADVYVPRSGAQVH